MRKYTVSLPLVVLFCSALIGMPDHAAAAQYSCDGRIQFRPCGQPMHSYKRRVEDAESARARSKDVPAGITMSSEEKRPATEGEPFAKITQRTFKTLSKGEGLWHGTVAGNGTVHLHLNIEREGVFEYTRYMGRIFLKNKSTWFSFKTMLPKGKNWSWNITAFAE